MSQPLVSIIIPCYNAEKYVAEAIQSALDQTYPNCEVIVIDDGSTDGSLEIIKSFRDKIRWETGPNRGGCAARNRGLELAQGEWIQFLDADDLISAGKVERQMARLKDAPKGSIATCSWRHFKGGLFHSANARPFWRSYERGVDLLVDTWLEGGFFCQHCWLVPRSLIESCGRWGESLTADQDGEFYGRIMAAASRTVFTPDVEALYRLPSEDNVSRNISRQAIESRYQAWQSVQKHLLDKRPDKDAKRAVLRRLRGVAYHARHESDLVEQARAEEKRLWLFDLNPGAPPFFRYAAAFLGLKSALRLRARFRDS